MSVRPYWELLPNDQCQNIKWLIEHWLCSGNRQGQDHVYWKLQWIILLKAKHRVSLLFTVWGHQITAFSCKRKSVEPQNNELEICLGVFIPSLTHYHYNYHLWYGSAIYGSRFNVSQHLWKHWISPTSTSSLSFISLQNPVGGGNRTSWNGIWRSGCQLGEKNKEKLGVNLVIDEYNTFIRWCMCATHLFSNATVTDPSWTSFTKAYWNDRGLGTRVRTRQGLKYLHK